MVSIKQNLNSPMITRKDSKKDASFGNGLITPVVTSGLNYLNNNPMSSIAVMDLFSCIGPRTYTDTKDLNPVAGTETFFRESSGLFFNCYFPGLTALAVAHALKGKDGDLLKLGVQPQTVWANKETIDHFADIFKDAVHKEGKGLEGFYSDLVDRVEVSYGKTPATLKDVAPETRKEIIDSLVDLSRSEKVDKIAHTTLKSKISTALGGHVNNIKLDKLETNIGNLINDAHSLGRAFSSAVDEKHYAKIADEAQKPIAMLKNHELIQQSLGKLSKSKTFWAFAITIPIAASLQTGLRAWTRKRTGKEGAPIYKDFGKDGVERKCEGDEKKKLLTGKILATVALVGISLATIGKKNLSKLGDTLQFKSHLTSMDQCRIVSTATFASRFWAAEDSNELKGSALRDIFGFTSLYVLGEFVQKGIVHMFGKGKDLVHNTHEAGEGFFGKLKHAFRGWDFKKQDEVIYETINKAGLDINSIPEAVKTKGLFTKGDINPKKVLEAIAKKDANLATELKSKLRVLNGAQAFSIAFSTVLLGLIIPKTMIKITEHNEKKRKAALEAQGVTEQPVAQKNSNTYMMGTSTFSDKSKDLFKEFVSKR